MNDPARREPSPPDAAPDPRAGAANDPAIALGLAGALLAVYLANGAIVPTHDASPNVYQAANLIEEGRVAFTTLRDPLLFDAVPPDAAASVVSTRTLVPLYSVVPAVRVEASTGARTYVGLYGPGAPVTALPILAAVRLFVGDLRADVAALWWGAKLAAAILVALSAAIVYLTCRSWVSRPASLALAAAYGLGTCAWSMSSQTLWQHAPNELWLALGTLFLVRGTHGGRGATSLALSGLTYAFATATRPTSGAFAAAAAVYLLWSNRRGAAAFLLGAAPVAAAIGAYNWYYLGSPLRLGQAAYEGPDLWSTPLHEGLAGLLLSPSRGLFFFSPFLLAAIAGAVRCWRDRAYAALRPLTVAAVVVLVVQAKWSCWWGGHGYGYRIIGDLATPMVVLVVPTVRWLASTWPRRAVFGGLVAWSVLLQAVGAFAYDPTWHVREVFVVPLPSGERYFETFEEALPVAMANRVVDGWKTTCGLDDPRCRAPLWSLRLSQPWTYASRLSASRAAQLESSEGWIRSWRGTLAP